MEIKNVILIVGGGTGGHISPGIALYEECNKRKIAVKFLAAKRDRRFKYMSEIDGEDLHFYGAPSLSKNPLKLLFFPFKFLLAVLHAKYIVKKYGITDVVGMGGYVSAPALFAFRKSKNVKVWLCEQNTVPGKVTARFLKFATKVFTTFDATEDYVKQMYRDKIECVGNPVRESIFRDYSKDEAKAHFNMEHCDKVILAIGGSQGAVQISELVLGMKLKYPDEFRNIGIIWSTGAFSYEHYREQVQSDKLGSIFLSPFIEDVGIAYHAADIAISRSGSGVMMELAAMKLPALLIPYPYAAQNHQSKNADVFNTSGAAVKVEGEKIKAETIGPIIFDILGSEARLRQMRRKCAIEARPHAAEDIVKAIIGSGTVDAV